MQIYAQQDYFPDSNGDDVTDVTQTKAINHNVFIKYDDLSDDTVEIQDSWELDLDGNGNFQPVTAISQAELDAIGLKSYSTRGGTNRSISFYGPFDTRNPVEGYIPYPNAIVRYNLDNTEQNLHAQYEFDAWVNAGTVEITDEGAYEGFNPAFQLDISRDYRHHRRYRRLCICQCFSRYQCISRLK